MPVSSGIWLLPGSGIRQNDTLNDTLRGTLRIGYIVMRYMR